VNEILKSNY